MKLKLINIVLAPQVGQNWDRIFALSAPSLRTFCPLLNLYKIIRRVVGHAYLWDVTLKRVEGSPSPHHRWSKPLWHSRKIRLGKGICLPYDARQEQPSAVTNDCNDNKVMSTLGDE